MTDSEIVKKYKDGIAVLDDMLQVQKDQAVTKHTIGVYNGMMFAKSVFDDTEPKYMDSIVEAIDSDKAGRQPDVQELI